MKTAQEIIRDKKNASNPQLVFLEAVKELKIIIEREMQEEAEKSEARLERLIDQELSKMEKALAAQIPSLDGTIIKLKGKDGVDAKPEDVARILLRDREFIRSIKPADGKTPTVRDLRAIIIPLIPIVKDGKTPSDLELLKLIKPLIPKKAKDGETPSDAKLLSLIKQIIPKVKEFTPDTPKQIATKLNSLKEALDPGVIKGFSKFQENMRAALRHRSGGGASGGGMGNWVHKTSSISSATTAITLDSRVAANGLAHIARYNGQVLDYGVHYTISGKVVTLLFTPEDSTTFSIAYVRS